MLLPLRLQGITKSYGEKRVLQGVDFEWSEAGVLGVVGANGAGKTVLMRILSGLDRQNSGEIFWGKDGNYQPRLRDRGMVLQQPIILHRSVTKNLEFALQGKRASERASLVQEALALAGLEQERDTFAPSLSGGQKQRLSLAQVWVMNSKLILLDEPSVHMDAVATEAFERFVKRLSITKNVPMILATHDLQQLRRLATKVAFLDEGKVQLYDSVDAFLGEIQDYAVRYCLRQV